MNIDRFQINLELLPAALQQELLDYYNYLLFRYRRKNDKKHKKKDFLNSVNKNKFSLPKNYQFDRDIANER